MAARLLHPRKPPWLKTPLPSPQKTRAVERVLRNHSVHTVCESALCPNRGECFGCGTATFMIMGNTCTRACRFCAVAKGTPSALDPDESLRVAEAAYTLGLRHVVITSVTRDDLPDGGATHFAATIRAVRARLPEATVEVLTPDFKGSEEALCRVLEEGPDVFNHNLETVPRLYSLVRPGADYRRSLSLLGWAAERGGVVVKTGWMVGLGEREGEVLELLCEVAAAGVHVVTIGQYLRPTAKQLPVVEYVPPEKFAFYRRYGEGLGLVVHAGPLVRSSYRANDCLSFVFSNRPSGRKRIDDPEERCD
ncbi:MAG: lipoyl synthase [Thermoleophilia bacterium]|nr:lipoyl synthase [Thermoleophilia bacterium]